VPICGAAGPRWKSSERSREKWVRGSERWIPSEVELTIFEGAQEASLLAVPALPTGSLKVLFSIRSPYRSARSSRRRRSRKRQRLQAPALPEAPRSRSRRRVADESLARRHDRVCHRFADVSFPEGPPADFPPGAGQSQSQPRRAKTSADCRVCRESAASESSFSSSFPRSPPRRTSPSAAGSDGSDFQSRQSHVCRLRPTTAGPERGSPAAPTAHTGNASTWPRSGRKGQETPLLVQ